jgi:hypothetical protein
MGNRQPKRNLRHSQNSLQSMRYANIAWPREMLEEIFINLQDENNIFNVLIVCKEWQNAFITSRKVWLHLLKYVFKNVVFCTIFLALFFW